MNLLAVPRKIVASEYRLLRLPLTAVHREVDRRLAEDNPVRITFERAVASVDNAAGTLTKDATLRRRGSALAHKVQAAHLARVLDDKASERVEEAQAALTRSRREAATRRSAALAEKAAAEAAVEKRRRAERAAAERDAAAKAAAAQASARREARAKRAAEQDRAEAAVTAIEKRAATRAKAPKQQMARASTAAQTAAKKRAEADRIAGLAAASKAKRTAR